MNRILIKLYVPTIEEEYDVWIPAHRRIHNIITLLIKAVNEQSGGVYKPSKMPILYDKLTGEPYDINLSVKESTIRNATEVVLI